MTTVTISPKIQVVIPKAIRERPDLHRGQPVQAIEYDGRIEFVPVCPVSSMRGFFSGIGSTVERDENADRVHPAATAWLRTAQPRALPHTRAFRLEGMREMHRTLGVETGDCGAAAKVLVDLNKLVNRWGVILEGRVARLAVQRVAMSDLHDAHDQLFVLDRAEDPVGALTDPVPVLAAQLAATAGPRIIGQRSDASHDALAQSLLWNRLDLADGRGLDEDPISCHRP